MKADAGLETAEAIRLAEDSRRQKNWKRWGPYLSERAWGTVREDYSPYGTAWEYLPHEHARSRAYRWGEDGLAGFCDRHQYICFALALWNGRDPILKERLFGLNGNEGNHGEDVKEYYAYLDATPTHAYMKYLYKYPQAEFPYAQLLEENQRRSRYEPEFELLDTGVFDENRYFDVVVEYAKAAPEDIYVRLEIVNRGPEACLLHVLPTVWFRNTWAWGLDVRQPQLRWADGAIELKHHYYGRRWLYFEGTPALYFTENETNNLRLSGTENRAGYVKDGIDACVVQGDTGAVNPNLLGTKAAGHYRLSIGAAESVTLRLRLTDGLVPASAHALGPDFDRVVSQRRCEADAFYASVMPEGLSADAGHVIRQAFAGLLWNKQFYYYEVSRWLKGDLFEPAPPATRLQGRNHEWTHLYNADVISMPDKWEYPWFAAWDLAFHCLPMALIDPQFAKSQLILLLREWYMHPNGQLPACEWNFGDATPPVHAWAAWHVYKIDGASRGYGDRDFLERVFHKLLLNFTWWVNRKDTEGRNVFQGGFLGLDNIGLFDRSAPLPTGGRLEQSDATSWMGMYCLNMLTIALELARENGAYEDVASKFFEHFVYICQAINNLGDKGLSLWDPQDGFYYDVLHPENGTPLSLKIRSMVGLIPLCAVETLSSEIVDTLPGFKRRMQWFVENRPEMSEHLETQTMPDGRVLRFLSLASRERLRRVLHYMLDENEFLSPYGLRSLSRFHGNHPYGFYVNGEAYQVQYEPAESRTGIFGGNSNWRGPVWFPLNFLLIEALQKFYYYLGDGYKIAYPTGSGRMVTLRDIAADLSLRLVNIFLRGADGRRPVHGGMAKVQHDPHWRDLILFYEYFHGDCGIGLGASHQTGWTSLVANLLVNHYATERNG